MRSKSDLAIVAKRLAQRSMSVTINPAFFEEVKEAYLEIAALLEEILRTASSWPLLELQEDEFTVRLVKLSDVVEHYFSLEETFGYLDDPVFVSAAYSTRVAELRAEHADLLAQIHRLSDHAARLCYNGRLRASADTILARLRVFQEQLEQHEIRESELITEAFNVDLGCGD
jgi:hypothetical protein